MRGISLMAVALVMMAANATDSATPLPNQIVLETSEKILEIINKDAAKLKSDPKEVERLVDEILLPVIDLDTAARD